MTNPLASAGAIAPHVTQVSGGGLEDYLPLILHALEASRARKTRQAEEAVGQVKPGTRGRDLTPQQKKAYKRATGVDIGDEQEVNPLPPDSNEVLLTRLEDQLGISRGSSADIGLRTSMARRVATGQAGPPTTPAAIGDETAASANVASAEAAQAEAFKSATGKLARAPQGQSPDLTPAEIAAYQSFNKFVPDEAISNQLSAKVRSQVMSQALQVIGHPDSAAWAPLLPKGVTPANAIGMIGLGLGGLLESAANRKMSLEVKANEVLMNTAEAVSKSMGGAYPPIVIANVMQGDPKTLATPAGQMILKFIQGGFIAAFTKQAEDGNPRFAMVSKLLELARVPQISGNPALLGAYSNAIQHSAIDALMSAWYGDRPQQAGPEQKSWDQRYSEMQNQTFGIFKYEHDHILGIPIPLTGKLTITPGGQQEPEQAAADKRQQDDSALIDSTLQALFPDTLGGQADKLKVRKNIVQPQRMF